MSKAGRATRSQSSTKRRTALMLSGGLLALVAANPALGQTVDALPTGGAVVAGAATIGTPSPAGRLEVTQSSGRAVIDWSSFDIGQDAEVAFAQPNATSIALNRVTGGTAPSRIAGKLTANGVVAVLNANGVLFAGTADVDVGGLIASTGQVDTAAFMAGGLLGITGATGGEIVVSAGADITVANAGLAAFVAPSVRNSGTITATAGRVQLGAGTAFTLDLAGDGLLQIGVGADNPLVQNLGSVFASGGQIQLSARQAGALLAQTIRTGVLPVGSARLDGATIVLDATGSDVQLTSTIAGTGKLVLSGNRIYGSGDIDVDGALTLNVNAGGAVADTLATGNNWINDALGVIGAAVDATTVNLGAGLYRPGTVINASNVTLDGHGVARIGWVSGIENAIDVWGDGVAIRNLEIFGPATSGFASFAWGSTNSRGIFVNRFADNVTVTGNNIHDIRTGVIVDGRNLNTVVTGNRIDNTKSAISVQYTDGANIALSGNFEGAIGNEWGINVHLNGILHADGETINPSTSSASGLPVGVLGTAGLAEQQRLMALRNANGGMAVQNIAYSAANRTRAYVAAGAPTNTQGSALNPLGTIQAGLNAVVTGGTVNVANGTYNLGTSALVINRSVALLGQSQAGVVIDGRAVNSSEGRGTISVLADNTTLANFTLYGSEQALGNYGIKVQPTNVGHQNTPGGDDRRLVNFAISDVTVRGSRRAELDLNGVVGATITNVTADGRSVAGGTPTAGAGVQISDSANVTLTGVHTVGNDWGSVGLYQSNKPTGFDIRTDAITIDASLNTFEESLGLFSQLESTTQGFGQLNLTGFGYAVRNTDHRTDDLDGQFIFYRTSLGDAVGFAKTVGTAALSSIEGYAGSGFSNVFTVADGLSINAAVRDVRSGGTVNVGAGTYAETVSLGKSITLDGAGIDATAITGGLLLSGALANLVLSDFAVSGSGGNAVIGNGGTIAGLTMNGVRVDGLGVTGRHGFIGGQIGGAISITNSEFVNIRNWAAFDTRSGAGTDQGSQITSGVFSNNLLDNTAGHIVFRQDVAGGAYPDITFANNTVRNVGNATTSFGAIFKAFNAGRVDFTGNTVSGVGTSGFNPAGEAAYGAVLMVRGPGPLNVTGNTFVGNNQVYAVEPGRALPATVTFTGNSFVDNAYAIYLPGNLAGSGTITFGAGNDFVAGPNTVRHILWRSPSALDLTGVSFDGTLAGSLGLAQAFAVEDLVTDGIDLGGVGLARLAADKLFVTAASGTDAALRAVALGADGDTLVLSAGTHVLTGTLFLTKDIDVAGQGKAATILDASGHGNWGIRVHADDVALSGFALNGSSAATNTSYGIKVEAGGTSPDRNTGFSITDVAIAGSRKNGLDLNAVVGGLIDGVSVTGVVAGNGISISDSADVIVRNSATANNAWGGLGLYQTNNLAAGGSDQQLTGITIEAGNAFAEAAGVYLQASSTLTAPGTLSVRGYGYTVRNPAHRSDGAQFTFFQKTAQDAYDYAANLASPGAGVVQGWTGSADDRNFYVGTGMLGGGGQRALSLQAAFGASVDGDTIHVADGIYAEHAVLASTRVLNFGEVAVDSLTLTGATSLQGNLTLTAGGFSATGPLMLTGATGITALAGDVSLGTVAGAHSLTLGGHALMLGSAELASLSAAGTSILTHGVVTTGAQSYTGAATLEGDYAASAFTVLGATTLAGATTVAATGDIALGTVGGGHALALAGADIAMGAAEIASLDATGANIATAGVTTTGAQRYAGATVLAGDYGASGFAVEGTATLAAETAIAATGAIALGTVSGQQALVLTAAAVALDQADLVSLTVAGDTIAVGGATTSGAQSYSGATVLAGDYRASDFTLAGAALLAGDTAVTVTGTAIFDTIDGGHDFALVAENAVLGTLGQETQLGALSVTADETVLLGDSYRAGSIAFAGGEGATVRLTQAEILFDTSAAGGAIVIAPHLIGTESGRQNVTFVTGAGAAGDGDIALGNVGSNDIRIGGLSVTGGDFSAATVKLAGDFVSVLGGSQVFSSQTLDTLGNVDAKVAGSESGPIVAGGAVSVSAGGSGTGSITAGGPVQLAYSDEVSREISSQSSVSLTAVGPVTGSIDATGPVGVSATGPVSTTVTTSNSATIASTTGVSSTVTAGGGVSLTSSQGAVSSQVSSGGTVSVNATGPVTGSITATGPVAVTASGPVSTTVKTDNSANISSTTGVSSTVTAGGGVSLASSQGAVSSQVSSGGTVSVTATGPVTGSITATGPVAVTASGPVSTTVKTDNSANISSTTGVSSTVTAGGGVSLTSSQGAVSSQVSSGGTVNVNATGPVTGSITATGPVAVTATGQISAAVSTQGTAEIASTSGVSSAVSAGGGVTVTATQGAVTGSIQAGGAVAVSAAGPVSAAVSTTGSANLVSTSGGVSSAINAGGAVAIAAPGPVTSTISSGGTIALTSNTPIDVQVMGGAVTVNAPGGQITGVFGEISTDQGGSFVVNDQPVIGSGDTDARQIIVDRFLAPVGGSLGPSGEIVLPAGLALAVLSPERRARGKAVVVNSVDDLGELLRRGYTAIIVDIDESGVDLLEDLDGSGE